MTDRQSSAPAHLMCAVFSGRLQSGLLLSSKSQAKQQHMDDEIPSIMVSSEEFMDVPSMPSGGARRNEDIALDLMKFIALTTGYGKTSSAGVGFQGGGAASKPEEYAAHLLELYGKCLQALPPNK